MRNNAAHLHCLNFIVLRFKECEVRIVGRHNAINLNIDCKVAHLEFVFLHDTLPAQYAGKLDFVGSLDRAEPRNLFDMSKFSHGLLLFNTRFEFL